MPCEPAGADHGHKASGSADDLHGERTLEARFAFFVPAKKGPLKSSGPENLHLPQTPKLRQHAIVPLHHECFEIRFPKERHTQCTKPAACEALSPQSFGRQTPISLSF
jgi:hypothetical protein